MMYRNTLASGSGKDCHTDPDYDDNDDGGNGGDSMICRRCHGGVGEVWKDYTQGPFTLRTVKGNHYFTHGNKTDTMAVIEE